eukprot:m51a1_g8872 putative serine threonine protein kinase (1182) ;mRNA; r:605479-609778
MRRAAPPAHAPALALALVSAALCASAGPAAPLPGDVVVGVSAGDSQIEQSAADGLEVAVREAAQLTNLPLRTARLNHYTEEDLMRNVRMLVRNRSAFMIATTTGTSDTQPRLLQFLRDAGGVPLVGTLSASKDLRDIANLTALYDRQGYPGFAEELPFVVNVRASGVVELDAVLSLLAHDWDVLQHVALVAHTMDYDEWVASYVNSSIRALTGASGLVSSLALDVKREHTAKELDESIAALFRAPEPRAVIIVTTPNTTAQFVARLAASGRRGLRLLFASWVSPEDLAVRLSPLAKSLLVRNDVQLYFTQNMPFPNTTTARPWLAMPLLRRFLASEARFRSHAALEGYLTGWFIYVVAQKAAARYGCPLTRQAFLHTVFADVRTFNVMGMSLGPYGDGEPPQSPADACNQGVHEVFVTSWDPVKDTQTPVRGVTLKFAGCSAPEWSTDGAVTVVGSFDDRSNGLELHVRAGVQGAVNAHNSEGASSMMLRSRIALNVSSAAGDLQSGNVVAVVTPELLRWPDVKLFETFATISPMPAHPRYVRPFSRRVVNLFPSAYDEMMAACMFFQNRSITRVAVVSNDNSAHTRACIDGLKKLNSSHSYKPATLVGTAEKFVQEHDDEYEAFLILGGKFDASSVPQATALRLLNSQVVSARSFVANSTAAEVTHTLSVFPPATWFASKSALRRDYDTWVSSESADVSSFMGFLVGKFLSQVVDVAKGGDPSRNLTADNIVDAVYHRGSFTVEGFQFGPFRDECSDDPAGCCNQGSNTVFVLRGHLTQSVAAWYDVGDCGWWFTYTPERETSRIDIGLILGLAIGLGGFSVLTAIVLAVAIWRTRTVEFFNINKGDVELGQCLGQGRFGAMYVADWHGTTVAVRVIDKKATPKEDQRLVKEDVLLLHKHHHPNLLMLMGYCETRSDILVVTEYMEGGTLAKFLSAEKQYASVYILVAMAFIDRKGTVKVSDFWYSSKKGAFSSSGSNKSLKRAAWHPPEVIAGTFLTPATDVYAFGIILWELIAPPDMTQSSANGTASEVSATLSSGRAADNDNGADALHLQLGPPEMPPNVSPAAADLMERCWQAQPERRPSIFQILRSWSITFASIGEFEIPQDLVQSVGSGNVAGTGLFSQHSSKSSGKAPARAGGSSEEDAASMVSIMQVQPDCDALQMPQEPQHELAEIGSSKE